MLPPDAGAVICRTQGACFPPARMVVVPIVTLIYLFPVNPLSAGTLLLFEILFTIVSLQSNYLLLQYFESMASLNTTSSLPTSTVSRKGKGGVGAGV